MLGSIERSLHKVRHALTPKKTLDHLSSVPTVLNNKDLFNVSTTHCKDPELVLTELSKGLEKKGILCKRKGFILKGSLDPNILHRFGGCSFELEICYLPDMSLPNILPTNNLTPSKSILRNGILQKDEPTPNKDTEAQTASSSSESIKPNENSSTLRCQNMGNASSSYVGIRRKRLKGDSWCYKKVCEEVLALTSAGFNNSAKEKLESAV
ncbi:uncharacterized protein LOC115884654 [Sitophilus oryzae]|uniref:non-specific serine/threonine protein kinase n=1 Tax=Sitophilus oryzae TaxID=7048 RepID=A0A6J2Y6C5_SITOR|nr:uncharacterized protein LOC115884654 [Sitophilus oryzae]